MIVLTVIAMTVLLGMSAPLLVATGSWILAERTYRRDPQALTSLMIAGFLFKLVFFGLYIAATMMLLSLIPQIHLWIVRGRDWNGAYVSSQGDEIYYSGYINALMDGSSRPSFQTLDTDHL